MSEKLSLPQSENIICKINAQVYLLFLLSVNFHIFMYEDRTSVSKPIILYLLCTYNFPSPRPRGTLLAGKTLAATQRLFRRSTRRAYFQGVTATNTETLYKRHLFDDRRSFIPQCQTFAFYPPGALLSTSLGEIIFSYI